MALYERVREFFSDRAVAKHEELGGRDAKWQAQNVVTLSDRRKAVFELVNTHPNSISSKFMMFSGSVPSRGTLLAQLCREEHSAHREQGRDACRRVPSGGVGLAQGNLSSVRPSGVRIGGLAGPPVMLSLRRVSLHAADAIPPSRGLPSWASQRLLLPIHVVRGQ